MDSKYVEENDIRATKQSRNREMGRGEEVLMKRKRKRGRRRSIDGKEEERIGERRETNMNK